MNELVKIAANDISELRKSDVFRVLEQNESSVREDLASFIIENRPDLEEEVNESLEDL